MEPNVRPVILNLGCGFLRYPEMVNVDKYPVCNPDVIHDLDVYPYPWPDRSVDGIFASHVFEHLSDWWGAFKECARVLKPGGKLDMRVPDESSGTALTYRDHKTVFSAVSFHGVEGYGWGRSAWANEVANQVPLRLIRYHRVPFPKYYWIPKWLLSFCANHLRNFIWEQRFYFERMSDEAVAAMAQQSKEVPTAHINIPGAETYKSINPFYGEFKR